MQHQPPSNPLVSGLSHRDLMLAKVYQEPFSAEGWLFDLKYDGYRGLALKEGGRVRLLSRLGNELGSAFPDVLEALAAIPGDFALDGELTVCGREGKPSFARLARRARFSAPLRIRFASASDPATYFAFDIIADGNQDLRSEPLMARRQCLSQRIPSSAALRAASFVEEKGEWLFEEVSKLGLEGIIAKRMDSPYVRGTSDAWRKIKVPGYVRTAD